MLTNVIVECYHDIFCYISDMYCKHIECYANSSSSLELCVTVLSLIDSWQSPDTTSPWCGLSANVM